MNIEIDKIPNKLIDEILSFNLKIKFEKYHEVEVDSCACIEVFNEIGIADYFIVSLNMEENCICSIIKYKWSV